MRRTGGILAGGALLVGASVPAMALDDRALIEVRSTPPALREVSPEADRLFDALVRRYRELVRYADVAWFEQVISQAGEGDAESIRSRIRVEGRIAEGRVEILTSATRLLDALVGPSHAGTAEPRRPQDRLRRGLDSAVAPHLALRLLDSPLRELRPEGLEQYRPTSIREVELADRTMLRLELRSGGTSPGDHSATLELTIDPESMLIHRVEGEERWPDGRTCSTSISIEPESGSVEPRVEGSREGPLARPLDPAIDDRPLPVGEQAPLDAPASPRGATTGRVQPVG